MDSDTADTSRTGKLPFPWLPLMAAVAALLAGAIFVTAWAVWLLNHRMGPLPTWLRAALGASTALLTTSRALMWLAEPGQQTTTEGDKVQ